MVHLFGLIGRNRMALIVLAGSVTSGAKRRARRTYSESAAVQWLTRNAGSVRAFIAGLAWLNRCCEVAGYRRLERAKPPRKLVSAPRVLRAASPPLPPRPMLVVPGVESRWRVVLSPHR